MRIPCEIIITIKLLTYSLPQIVTISLFGAVKTLQIYPLASFKCTVHIVHYSHHRVRQISRTYNGKFVPLDQRLPICLTHQPWESSFFPQLLEFDFFKNPHISEIMQNHHFESGSFMKEILTKSPCTSGCVYLMLLQMSYNQSLSQLPGCFVYKTREEAWGSNRRVSASSNLDRITMASSSFYSTLGHLCRPPV